MKIKARQLRQGDVIASKDGRGDERVLHNLASHIKGKRFIRTSRCDHVVDGNTEVDVVSLTDRCEH